VSRERSSVGTVTAGGIDDVAVNEDIVRRGKKLQRNKILMECARYL
jgi:hypothetical protein